MMSEVHSHAHSCLEGVVIPICPSKRLANTLGNKFQMQLKIVFFWFILNSEKENLKKKLMGIPKSGKPCKLGLMEIPLGPHFLFIKFKNRDIDL